jgi:hypothetical protein
MGFCALDFGVLVASRKGVKKDVFCYAFHQAKETPASRGTETSAEVLLLG